MSIIQSKFLALVGGVARTIDISAPGNIFEVSSFSLKGSTSGSIGIKASATTTPYTITLPDAVATGSGMVLVSDTSGNLSWASAAAGSALDSVFVIQNTADNTKQIKFSAAGIATGTTRTITMPDANVDLGALTNSNISTSAAIAFSKLATLASGNLLVGSAGGVATSVAMSGEASIVASGAVTLSNAAVIAKLLTSYSASAGTVSSSDSIISAIQKIDGNDSLKLPLAGGTMSGNIAMSGSKITGLGLATQNGDALRYDELGAVNGIATLDGGGKVPLSQLPSSVMEFKGNWNPNTNTPSLVDGTGTSGFTYWVTAVKSAAVSGLDDTSMVNFQIGDLVIYNGSAWQLVTPAAGVQSVNGAQGAVTVNAINQLTGDVTASAASGSQSKATTVVSVGGSLAADVHSAELAANAATNLNTASTIVKRDSSGNFVAGTITAALTGHASADLAIANNLSDVASASSSFDNISPMTTLGDIITGGASGANQRLGIGSAAQVLTVVAGVPAWSAPSASAIALAQNHILVGDAGGFAADVAMSGDVTIVASGATTIGASKVLVGMLNTITDGLTLDQLGTGGLLEVKTGGINNAQIGASAAIAFSKLAALSSANILVGSAGNVATSVAMSGEATISNAGAVTLSNAAVIAKVLTGYSAGLGTVSSSDSLLSAIQKLDANDGLNLKLAGGTMSGAIAMGSSKITGLAAGSASGDAVRYEQVILVDGSNSFSADQPMASHKLTGLSAGSAVGDSVRYEQVILADGTNIFTASQSMGFNKLTSLAPATGNGDAVRFEQAVLTDGSNPITGNQSFSSTAQITNLVDPSLPQDAATKKYVDDKIAGQTFKVQVESASNVSENIVISAPGTTIGGYTIDEAGDRILLKDQTAPAENGIWIWNGAAVPMTRATDADTWDTLRGAIVYVAGGDNNGAKFINVSAETGALGTDPQVWTTFSATSSLDGSGTAGYNAYWTATHTLAAEQYVATARGGFGLNTSAFTGVVKASAGSFSASSLVNADVSASAAIDFSKLATLASGNLIVGSSGGVATSVAVTGDVTISDLGVTAIGSAKVTNAMLAGSIADSKLSTITTANKVSGSAIQLNASGAISDSTGLKVNVDNSSIEIATNALQVKAGGITNAMLAGSIDYSKLVLTNSIVAGDLTATSVDKDKINTNVFDQVTITGGAGTSASVASAPAVKQSMVAGESFAASLFAVRFAKAADSGYVAGRVYKADNDTTSADNFHVVGLTLAAASVAGAIVMTEKGSLTATGHGFTIGAPLFLDSAGAVTETPPTAVNSAVVKVGMAKDANTIEVQINIIAIN